MNFTPQAVPAEILPLVRRFISITTWKPWSQRLEQFDRLIAGNPLLDEYLAERYPIELAMRQLHGRLLRGQKIKLPATYAETALFSFIAMVARVYPRLSARGQVRLAGMARSGLDTEAGLAPLELEMGIAAHLMGRGFDVTFSDMETGSGFDFLVEKEGAALEIECKTVSGDLGRKIHLRRLYQLGGRAFPLMTAALERRTGGQITLIVLPERLYGTDQQFRLILKGLAEALETGKSIAGPDPCAIKYREFSLVGSPFETINPSNILREDVRQWVAQAVDMQIENAVMLFRPSSGVMMIAVESQQKDTVIRGLIRQLKDSVKQQFSGTRPGVVCVKFLDVTQRGLLEVAEKDKTEQPSALGLASNYLLNREDWTPIHTIAYLTPGHPMASRVVRGEVVTSSIQEQSHTYTFTNPRNPMARDGRYVVF